MLLVNLIILLFSSSQHPIKAKHIKEYVSYSSKDAIIEVVKYSAKDSKGFIIEVDKRPLLPVDVLDRLHLPIIIPISPPPPIIIEPLTEVNP